MTKNEERIEQNKSTNARKIQKTRKDPAHIRGIQRYQEHLEHQISEEKSTHPKDKKKWKEAKSSHQEKELSMSLDNSKANCMLTTNVMKQSWKPTWIRQKNDKGDQSAGVEETKDIPEFTMAELYKLFSTLLYNKLYSKLDRGQPADQRKFRRSLQTLDHLATYKIGRT